MASPAEQLIEMGACQEAVEWVRDYPSLRQAWRRCHRGDWMLWWAGRVGVSGRSLVRAACQCARLALPYVPDGEERPLRAIETAEAWARGEDSVTLDDVRHASAASAAYAASYAAASAASAAAYAASYAAASAAAYAAASAAASAASVASYAAENRRRLLRECATICRREWPTLPAPEEGDDG